MKSIFVGSLLAAIVASAGLSSVSAKTVGQEHISWARVAAIRECNIKASPFAEYVWGNVKLDVYRECMFDEDQAE